MPKPSDLMNSCGALFCEPGLLQRKCACWLMQKKHQKCSREQQPRYRWPSYSCSRKAFDSTLLSPTFTFLHNSPIFKSEKRCWFRRARVPSTFVFFQQQRKVESKFFSRIRRLTERIENRLGAPFSFKTPFSLKVVFLDVAVDVDEKEFTNKQNQLETIYK